MWLKWNGLTEEQKAFALREVEAIAKAKPELQRYIRVYVNEEEKVIDIGGILFKAKNIKIKRKRKLRNTCKKYGKQKRKKRKEPTEEEIEMWIEMLRDDEELLI